VKDVAQARRGQFQNKRDARRKNAARQIVQTRRAKLSAPNGAKEFYPSPEEKRRGHEDLSSHDSQIKIRRISPLLAQDKSENRAAAEFGNVRFACCGAETRARSAIFQTTLISNMSARSHDKKWSSAVTHGSNALDLDKGVFKMSNPHRIALSLKRSAEHSHRRKSSSYQSAMSMLNFYINRAGHNLSARQKNILTHAKEDLRQVFHKPAK
jgi:hypothetical protein